MQDISKRTGNIRMWDAKKNTQHFETIQKAKLISNSVNPKPLKLGGFQLVLTKVYKRTFFQHFKGTIKHRISLLKIAYTGFACNFFLQ